jgi:LCP family protein required for cell wall assembly
MANDNDSDPFERYFRPRPGSPEAEAQAGAQEGAEPGGVVIGGTRAPHVPVEPRAGGHRRRAGTSRDTPGGPGHARRQRRLLTITAAMSSFVLLTSGGAWAFQGYVLGQVDKIDPFQGLGDRPGGGPKGAMNILVAGVDRRQGLTREQIKRLRLGRFEGERSDTMMVVHLSRDHDRISVISLPRDSLVTIPEHASNGSEGAKGTRIPARQGKLGWTYGYGGSPLTINTIEKTTGVRIDHYIEVNFLGFIKMVDALGGVTVCTPQPINDPKSGLVMPAGKSAINGEKALAYARARYTLPGGSDLGRIDRQQQFMAALMHQALSTSTLTDPGKATGFLNASLEAVRVDKELAEDAPALLEQLKGLSTDSVAFANVPLADPNYQTRINGVGAPQSTVLWDQAQARPLFQKINKDEPLTAPAAPAASPSPTRSGGGLTVAPADIQVHVVNGVGTPGMARDAAGDLRKAGFNPVVVPGTYKRLGVQQTIIQYGPDRADSARTLAAAIPGARLKKLPSLGDRVQVVVGSSWHGARKVQVAENGQAPTGATAPAQGGQNVPARTATEKMCK